MLELPIDSGARDDRRRPHRRCQDHHAAAIRGAEYFQVSRRRVGRAQRVPTICQRASREMVGTLRFAHAYNKSSKQRALPVISSAAGALRGAAFFAGFGSSAARSSSVIGSSSCASSLATRLTRVEISCQANSPSRGPAQQRHHVVGVVGAAIEPALEIARAQSSRARGDAARRDRRLAGAVTIATRVDLLAVRPHPGFRERGKADRTAVAAMDEVTAACGRSASCHS